ncbi:MAG: FAD-binding oxidoreductase [Proteobacteria bacterium]|nr:FAD-binding oxidoreductase [Pseudomonadota bacterium]MDA0927825.1 FAD-binding oxidoreductase [Pseudomonadota bacterium]
MADWIQGKIVENIHWTENLFTLRIDADIKAYKAGQFTSLALDIDGERIARPYSHLSAPHQRPLEYFFYTATGGVLSNALVQLNAGDTVWVKDQSNGFFVLEEVPDCKDLWMLGTGTGIAPFLSILHTDEPWQRFENIVLVYAVRTESDLRYLDTIEALKESHGDRFRFQAFVSREQVPGTLHGRIPAAIEDGRLQQAVGLEQSADRSHFMLCGNPDMVKDVTELLKTRDFRKNRRRTPGHITTENYW